MIEQIQIFLLSLAPSIVHDYPESSLLEDLLSRNLSKVSSLVWCSLSTLFPLQNEAVPRIKHLALKYIFSKKSWTKTSIEELESSLNFIMHCQNQFGFSISDLSQWAEGYIKPKDQDLYK